MVRKTIDTPFTLTLSCDIVDGVVQCTTPAPPRAIIVEEDHPLCQFPDGVKEISMINQGIDRIPGCMSKYTGLKKLSLDGNRIAKIENLGTLAGLKELYLDDNRIKKIENLDGLTGLKDLYLSRNQIKKIEGLGTLTGLKELFLGANQIKKIEGLDKLASLEWLSLFDNQIKKIENLDKLERLKTLDLEETPVPDDECDAFKKTHPSMDVFC